MFKSCITLARSPQLPQALWIVLIFFLIPLYLSDSTPSQAAVTVRKEKKKKTFKISSFKAPSAQVLSSGAEQQGNLC